MVLDINIHNIGRAVIDSEQNLTISALEWFYWRSAVGRHWTTSGQKKFPLMNKPICHASAAFGARTYLSCYHGWANRIMMLLSHALTHLAMCRVPTIHERGISRTS